MGRRVVVAADQAFGLGQDRGLRLRDGSGRQTAVVGRKAHRAAGQHHARAKLLRCLGLDVDRSGQGGGEQVVVVAGRGAAREHQLGQRETGGHRDRLFREVHPDRVQRLQPGEQRLVQGGRTGTRQGLVEMVMAVDEAGQQHLSRRIEDVGGGCLGLLAHSHQLHDSAVAHDDATGSVEVVRGEDRRGLPDPGGWFPCRHCFGVLMWRSAAMRRGGIAANRLQHCTGPSSLDGPGAFRARFERR